ncbi:PKD domain-containing protein [Flavobacterium sp.]|uniref:Ig-like domain-containing protein n=1 Tax=Flavobacterium sp. TaxID=239 RepID=UPI00120CBD4F|nr:PKD domain-containing protein [Flavobacterium sp.]RZJ73542.1 MAG: T9SS type A sorting domain-containing protein [Flavobacterium sp.]
MKQILKHFCAFWLLLAGIPAMAQYNGGVASGASTSVISATSCGMPSFYYAYFGGSSDGASVNELLATTCSSPGSFYAYFGGFSDGSAVDELSATSCGIPPSFFAYMGGTSDGADVHTLEANTCAFPPQFYAYFGGSGQGFSMGIQAICPVTPPDAEFTASTTTLCQGSSVIFTDTSTNVPAAWSWSFPGGTPSVSTIQNPTVVYNTPGTYSVTLVATNYNGSNTEVKSNFITVTVIPAIQTTTPSERCGSGTVTLSATANAGTINWYADATTTTVLATGSSFTTPSLSATTTYYVGSSSGSCASPRTAVTATIKPIPTITATTPNSRCGTGSVTLSATASAGAISWYSQPSGGTSLGSGASFATPSIAATTTYYVEVSNGGCVSPRTSVIATVNPVPEISSVTSASRCGSGSVTLTASGTATLNWYGQQIGGSVIFTGNSFVTGNLSVTTTYYVEAANANCSSPRTAVTATINTIPSITSTVSGQRCDSGSVTLSAATNVGTLNWYNVATGGTILGSGTTFTTPSLINTTSYFVESVNGDCISVRTEVVATVNTTPTVTSTTPASRCGTGSVTLQATASAGTLSWFSLPSGGIFLGSGTSLATGNISATTTYYVEASSNGCTSPRTAVIATINDQPTITNTIPTSRCDFGALTLTASASSGTISWFDVAIGGSAIATGSSFTTQELTASATYYVETTNGICTSPRIAVTATISPIAAPTGIANQTFCTNETVGMLVVNGTNVIWYDAATNGNVVPDNTILVAGNTYFATQTVGSCESETRLAVTVSQGACLGIRDIVKNELQVYPNPVNDFLTVSYTDVIQSIRVVNMLGQELQKLDVNASESKVNLSGYAAGTYLIFVDTQQGTRTVKIIKR